MFREPRPSDDCIDLIRLPGLLEQAISVCIWITYMLNEGCGGIAGVSDLSHVTMFPSSPQQSDPLIMRPPFLLLRFSCPDLAPA